LHLNPFKVTQLHNEKQLTNLYTMRPIIILKCHVISNTNKPLDFLSYSSIIKKIWISWFVEGSFICKYTFKQSSSHSKRFKKYWLGVPIFIMDWRKNLWFVLTTFNAFERRLLFTKINIFYLLDDDIKTSKGSMANTRKYMQQQYYPWEEAINCIWVGAQF
jgi:hypothetical protein